jgi:MFS family permease
VRAYLVSRFFSGLGRSLLSATLAWHVWKLTESYFVLGAVGLIQFLPVIPVSLYAGAFADAHDRRKIVLATQALSLLGAALLAVATGNLASGDERSVVLGTAFALAFATSFENPAGTSILPSLVPRRLFAPATVVIANARNVASVSGPVLMGIITGAFGIAAAYSVTMA